MLQLLASILCLIWILYQLYEMGFIRMKEPVYPFSGFSGQLEYQGKPAAYAKVTRSYQLFGEDEVHEETIQANDEGRFSFESIVVNYKTPLLSPLEFLSYQKVFVDYDSKAIQIWGTGKRTKEEFSEFGGQPMKLNCELTDELRRVDIHTRGVVGTICRLQAAL